MLQTKVLMKDAHCFHVGDKYILLDVPSGSIFRCDSDTEQAFCVLEETDGDFAKAEALCADKDQSVRDALTELAELTEEEILFTKDTDSYTPPISAVKSLCLNISHDCDLRCAYCFASTGSFGGERLNMPLDVAIGAIDFLLHNSGNRKFLEVDFFGGEPMLNINVVKATVAYAKQEQEKLGKKIAFTFTTNAVSLTPEVTEWANQEDISVVLSHDGRKEIHDATRRFAGGGGSYDIVTSNISRHIKDGNGKYYVRGTYTAQNLDFVNDIKHWLDKGWDQLSMEPAVEKGGKRALLPEHLLQIRAEYEKLVDLYLERQKNGEPFEFFHFNMNLENSPCLPKRLTGCGAGYEYYVVIPTGDIYPCHQFVGRKEYLMGNLKDGITATDRVAEFRNCHVYTKEKCRNCWARYYCSGGCHANAQLFNDDIYQPYEMGCELSKIRTECSLAIALENVK